MAPITRNSTTNSPYAEYIEEAFASTPLDSIGTLIEQDVDHEVRKPSYSSLGDVFSQGVKLSYRQAAPKALYTSCAILSASLNTWVYCVALSVNSVYRIAHYDRLYNALKGILIKHSEEASTNRGLFTKIKEVAIKIFLSPLLVISATILTLVSVITIALGAVISVLVPAISPIFLALFAMQSLVTVVGNTFTTSREVYAYIRDRVLGVRDSAVPDVDLESNSQDEQHTVEFTHSIFRKIAASISGVATAVFLIPIQLCLSLPSVAIPPTLGALLTPVMLMSSLFNIRSLNQIFYGMSTLINPKRTIVFDGKELRTEDMDEVGLILRIQGISPSALRSMYKELRATGVEKEFFTRTGRYTKHLDALKAEVRQLKLAAADMTAELEQAVKVYEGNERIVGQLAEDLGFIRAGESSVQQSRTSSELLKAEAELNTSKKTLEELQTRRSYLEHKIFKAELRMFSISSAIAVIRKNLWESAFLTARENVSALVPSVESAIQKSIVAENNVILAKRKLADAESDVDQAKQSLAHAQSQLYAAKFKPQEAVQEEAAVAPEGATEGQQVAAASSTGDATNVASGQLEQDLSRAKEYLDACLESLKVAKKNVVAAEAKKLAENAAEGRVIAKYSEALRERDKAGVALEKGRIEEYKNKTRMYNLIEVRDVRDIPGIQKSKIPITEKEKEFIREYLDLSSEKISAAHEVISELKSRLEYPTYYESVVLTHRKNLLLRDDNASVTREDSKNPETASILDARSMLLPSASADCQLKSAEAYYRNSLKKLSDIDARGTTDSRSSHAWSAKMARMEVTDSKALYNLSLKERDLVSAQEKVEQCTKLYDASVRIANNRDYIASAAAHDLNLLLSAAPKNKKEISIASNRLRTAKEEAGEAKLVVAQNAELLKEATSALNSIESTIYDAKRAHLKASHALKSAMIEQSKTSPEHVLSEKEKYALEEAHVLASDAHREQTISDICTFLCAPHERDTTFSLIPEQKIYETCSDIVESIRKKRIDMYNAHKQAHDSEKRFLLYVYNKVENDLSYTESLAKLAHESGETQDSEESYEQTIASLRDLSYSARIAVSAMQVLSDQISSAHDVHSYQLTTQRMVPAAYAEIARIRDEVSAKRDSGGDYDITNYESTNKIIKLSRLAARHCSAAVEECILRYKYENTEQLKALASSNVKRISAINPVNSNETRAKAFASSEIPSAIIGDIRARSESLHESAYLLYDVTNLIGDSCSFSDNITDTVDRVCKKLCKAFEELDRAKTLLENASESERNEARAVYKDAVRQMALQSAYHDKVMSECNVAASLARVLSAAQNVNSAKKAFTRYENAGIKDLLIKRAEAEFNVANAHFCIVQLAHKKKSAKLHLVASSVDLDKANDQHEMAEEAISRLHDRLTSLNCDPSTESQERRAAADELESAIQSEASAKASVVRAQEIKKEAELLLKDTEMQYDVIHVRSNAVIEKAEELNDHIVGMIKDKILRSSNPSVSRELKSILNSVHGSTNTSSELERTSPRTNEEDAEDELKFLEASMRSASSLQYLIMSETEVLRRMKSLEQQEKLREDIIGEQYIDDTTERNALELARSRLAHATACSEAAKAHSALLDSLSDVYDATCNVKHVHENTSSSTEERSAATASLEEAKQQADVYKILLEIAEAKKDVASASLECCITSEIVRKIEEQGETIGRYRVPTGSRVHISDILKKYKNEHHNAQLRKELATLKHELAQTFSTIHEVEQQRDRAKSQLSNLQKGATASQTRWDAQRKVADAIANLNSLKEKSRTLQEKIGKIATKVRARDGILDIIENVGITRSTQNAYSSFPFRGFQEFSVFTSDKIFVTTKEDTQLFTGREAAEDISQEESTFERTSGDALNKGDFSSSERTDIQQSASIATEPSGQAAMSKYADTYEKHAETKFTLESTPAGTQDIARHVNFGELGNDLRLITARKNLEYWDNEVLRRTADVHSAYLDYTNSKISIDRGSSLPVHHQHIDDESHLGIIQNFTIWETAKANLAVAMAERNVASKDVEIVALTEELATSRTSYKAVRKDISFSATEKKSAQDLVESSEKKLQLAETGKKVAVAELRETLVHINLKKATLAHKYAFGKKLRTPEEARYANLSLSSAEKELKLAKEDRILVSRRFALLSANFHKYNALRSLHAAEAHHEYVTQNPSLHTDKDRDEATKAVAEATRLVDTANKDIDIAREKLREAHISDDKLESNERDLKFTQLEKYLIECGRSRNALTAELRREKNRNKCGELGVPPAVKEKICYMEKKLDSLLCEESYFLSGINLLKTLAALDDLRTFNKYVQESSSYTAKEQSSAETLLRRKELEVELAKTQREMAGTKLELAYMKLNKRDVRAHPVEGELSDEGGLHAAATEETIAKHDEDIALSKLEILNAENRLLRTTMYKHEMERIRKCTYESESCTARERMLADRDLQLADEYTEFSIVEKNVAEAKLAVLEATNDVAVAEDNKRRVYEDKSCTVRKKKAANTILDNAIKALREAKLAENIAKSERNLLLYGQPSDEVPELEFRHTFNEDIPTTNYVKVTFLQKATSEYLKLELSCLQEAAMRGKSGVHSIDGARKDLVKSANEKIASMDKKLADAERELETLCMEKSTEPESSGIQSFETQLAFARRDLAKAERVQANSYLRVVKAFEKLSKVCDHYKITGGDVDFSEHGSIGVNEDVRKALNELKIALGDKGITDAKLDVANARIAVIEASKHYEEARNVTRGEVFLTQEGANPVDRIKATETKLKIAEAMEHLAKARESAAIARSETINNFLLDKKDLLEASANAMRLSEAEVDIARARLDTIIAYEAHSESEHDYTDREESISIVSEVCKGALESVTRSEEKLAEAVVREQLAEKALKDIISSQKKETSASHDSEVLKSRQDKDSGEALLSTTSLVGRPEENLQRITEQIPILFSSVSSIEEGVNKITEADISRAIGDIANRRSLVLLAIRNREELEQQRQLIYKNEAATVEERISIDKSLEDANTALEFATESRNIAEIKLEILKTAKTLKIVKDKKRTSAYKYELHAESDEQNADSDIDALKLAILRANAISSRLEVAKINKELKDLAHVEGNVAPAAKSEIAELCKKAAEADLDLFATTKAYRKISDDLMRSMQKADREEIGRGTENLQHAEKALEMAEKKKASVDSAITLLSVGKATSSAKGGIKLKSAGETTSKEKLKDADLEKQLEFAKLHKEAADANIALFYATRAYQKAMDARTHAQESTSELTKEQQCRKRELEIAEARKAAIDSAITLLNEYKALEKAKYNIELIGAGILIHCDEAQAQKELDSQTENVKFAEASRNALYARYEVLKSSAELASSKSDYERVSKDLDKIREDTNRAFSRLRNAKYEFEISKQKTQVADAVLAVFNAAVTLKKGSNGASGEKGREAAQGTHDAAETLQFLKLKGAIAKAELMVLEATYHLATMEDKYIAEYKSSSTFEEKSDTYALLLRATRDLQIAKAARNSGITELAVFNATMKLKEATSSAASDLEIQEAQHALALAETDKDVAYDRLNTLYIAKKSESAGMYSQELNTDHVDSQDAAMAHHLPRAKFTLQDYGESIVGVIDRFSDERFFSRAPRKVGRDIITDFFEDNEEYEYVQVHKGVARAKEAVSHAARELENAQKETEQDALSASCEHKLQLAELQKELAEAELQLFSATVALRKAIAHDKFVNTNGGLSTSEAKLSSAAVLSDAQKNQQIASYIRALAEAKLEVFNAGACLTDAERYYEHVRDIYKNSHITNVNLVTAFSEVNDAGYRLKLAGAREAAIKAGFELFTVANEFDAISKQHEYIIDSDETGHNRLPDDEKLLENAKRTLQSATEAKTAADEVLFNIVRESRTQDKHYAMTVGELEHVDESDEFLSCSHESDSFHTCVLESDAIVEEDTRETLTSRCFDVTIERVAPSSTIERGQRTPSQN